MNLLIVGRKSKTQMRNMFYWVGIISILICLPLRVSAQSYEQMWKQVEVLEQKQLPKSAIQELRKIYEYAKQEKNVSQMMKAHLTRASLCIDITPDSLDSELSALKAWMEEEKDTVYQAILNNLLGYYILDTGKKDETAIDTAIAYFQRSLQDKEILFRKSAVDYRPMTNSKELSEKYCGDNMYQLLARQAISRLSGYFIANPVSAEKIQTEILSIYDGLIDFYRQQGMTDARLLLMLDKLHYKGNDVSRGGVNERLRLTDEQVITLLKQWAEEFADSPLCGEVYCQLAERYDRMQDYTAKLKAAQTGLAKYPRSLSANDLKEQIAEVLTPRLMVEIPFAYPGKDVDLKVKYRNLAGLTVELYRMNLPVTSPVLEREINASTLSQYGKLVSSRHYDLAATPDYKETDTLLRYKFPVEGIYVVKSIPDGHRKYTAYGKAGQGGFQRCAIAGVFVGNRGHTVSIQAAQCNAGILFLGVCMVQHAKGNAQHNHHGNQHKKGQHFLCVHWLLSPKVSAALEISTAAAHQSDGNTGHDKGQRHHNGKQQAKQLNRSARHHQGFGTHALAVDHHTLAGHPVHGAGQQLGIAAGNRAVHLAVQHVGAVHPHHFGAGSAVACGNGNVKGAVGIICPLLGGGSLGVILHGVCRAAGAQQGGQGQVIGCCRLFTRPCATGVKTACRQLCPR